MGRMRAWLLAAVALVVAGGCRSPESDAAGEVPGEPEGLLPGTPDPTSSAHDVQPAPLPEVPPDSQLPPPTTPPGAKCAPIAGGPYWLTEGEDVSFTVRCALAWPQAKFEVIGLPAGASFDAASGAFAWTPAMNQAAVYELRVRETTTGEEVPVKVGVADAFDHDDNEPIADPAKYTEEYGLPVFHLSFEDKLHSSAYSPAQLVYRGHSYVIGAKYRGATSLSFPKRSYTLEFSDADEFKDPLVGFGNRDKLVLITSFNDNSYVRPKLAFDLWRRMDPQNIPVKTFFAVLIVNGKYWGLYTAADHVDSDLMRRSGLRKEGNLFKAFHADANFTNYMTTGEEKWAFWQGYEKKEGLPEEGQPGAMDDISELTEFVITSPDDELIEGLQQRLHLRDYENWWIFTTLILGTDSTAKNAYHYHDPLGGPFRYIPWDLDASFGQEWDTARTTAYWRADFGDKNGLFERMLDEPALIGPMRDRYRTLLQNELSKDEVLKLYDALQAQVRDVALRDERRWGDDYRTFERWSYRKDFLDYAGEAAYVREWIDERWDALKRDGPP